MIMVNKVVVMFFGLALTIGESQLIQRIKLPIGTSLSIGCPLNDYPITLYEGDPEVKAAATEAILLLQKALEETKLYLIKVNEASSEQGYNYPYCLLLNVSDSEGDTLTCRVKVSRREKNGVLEDYFCTAPATRSSLNSFSSSDRVDRLSTLKSSSTIVKGSSVISDQQAVEIRQRSEVRQSLGNFAGVSETMSGCSSVVLIGPHPLLPATSSFLLFTSLLF